MDLSIVILNYKTAELCRTCIRGIKKYSLNISYEIIIVDNHSNDGIEKIIHEEFPEVIFIAAPKNIGHSAGNNLGFKIAKGRHILMLNSDIITVDNSLEKMVQYIDQNPQVGALGCQLLNPDRSIQETCRRFYSLLTPLVMRSSLGKKTQWGRQHLDYILMKDFNHQQTRPVDWVQGSCVLIRKNILQKINYLDERFFLYFGDVDLCKEIWDHGYEVHYYTDAKIIHYFHQESKGGIRSIFKKAGRLHLKDWFQYLLKHGIKNKKSA